jgi:hypothetical protein
MRRQRTLVLGLSAALLTCFLTLRVSPRDGSVRLAVGTSQAHALLFGKFFKSVGKAFKKVGKGIGTAFKKVGKGIAKGVKAVGKGLVRGLKTVGRGLWKATKAVGKGIAWAAKKTWAGVKWVAKKMLAPFKWIYEKVKKFIQKNGPKIAKFLKKYAGKFLDKVVAAARKFVPEIGQVYDMIKSALNAAQQIVDAIRNPKEIVERGKAWAVEKLADIAMTALSPLLKKAFALIVGAAIKLAKHIATTPIAGMIAGAIASVTFGIGGITMGFIKLALDKLFDFIIDKVKELVANLLFGGAKGLLKKAIVKPLVNGAYDAIVKFIKKKFPKLFAAVGKAAEKVREVGDQAGKVLDAVKQSP